MATSTEESFVTSPPAYQTVWVQQVGGLRTDSGGYYGITSDNNENIYAVSGINGPINPSEPPTADSLLGGIIIKSDSGGERKWTRLLGSSSARLNSTVADNVGSFIYVVGYSYDAIGDQANNGGMDALIAKYDQDGNQLWVRQFGTAGSDWLTDVAIDSTGNVFASGVVGGILDGQPFQGPVDAFIVKYDSNGNRLWTRTIGSNVTEYANGLAIHNESVYLVGDTNGSLDGQTHTGNHFGFIVKYDSTGNQLWVKQFDSTGTDQFFKVNTDSSGNLYVVGNTYDSNSFMGQTSLGGMNAIMAKFDSDGNLVFAKQFGTGGAAFDVAIRNNSVFITGQAVGALNGEKSAGDRDAFLVQYDSAGNLLNTSLLGTTAMDGAMGITTTASNVYIAGFTFGDLGSGLIGIKDIFVAKY
ncbi:MAG: hypothetical protein A3A28_03435 [Candidatus Sungbacteria bacterium RIFCSPLOWO2_01_FULL_47_32]|nr:MAG: hypothetical protein A3A28_03435 [Candidatus Sungbacteria bacterium RIFCSPLOWO2_01_FULL_47_32]